MKNKFRKNLILLPLVLSFLAKAQEKSLYFDHSENPCGSDTAYIIKKGLFQEGKWHTLEYHRNNNQPFAEAYYLDPVFQQKDSLYISYHDYSTRKIETTGRYYKGTKTGLWLTYSSSGRITDSALYPNGHLSRYTAFYESGKIKDTARLDAHGAGLSKGYWESGLPEHTGQFSNWEKTGKWLYYNQEGVICASENMVADTIASVLYYDSQGRHPIVRKPPYEEEAEYPGGIQRWLYYISKSINAKPLPDVYLNGKVDGVVQISFVINETGQVTEIKVRNSIHPDLDSLAVSVIRNSADWHPSMEHNRHVNAYKIQPFAFAKLTDQ